MNYLGSEDTFIHVSLEATGLVQGVKVSIGGVSVTVNVTLGAEDVIEIDSETKTVKVNGVDVPPADYNGEQLPKLILSYGENVVSVEDATDEGNTAFDAQVTYTGRYGGL